MEYDFFDTDEDFVLDLDDALQAELEDTEWEDAVGELSEDMPLEERVALYQRIRTAGVLPDDASFFLIVWALENLVEERVTEIYEKQYAMRFARVAEEQGLDDDLLAVLESDELPQEYRALQLEFAAAVDALEVAVFQSFGELKMATLYKTDPEEFDRRYDAGYAYFFGEAEGYASNLGEELQD